MTVTGVGSVWSNIPICTWLRRPTTRSRQRTGHVHSGRDSCYLQRKHLRTPNSVIHRPRHRLEATTARSTSAGRAAQHPDRQHGASSRSRRGATRRPRRSAKSTQQQHLITVTVPARSDEHRLLTSALTAEPARINNGGAVTQRRLSRLSPRANAGNNWCWSPGRLLLNLRAPPRLRVIETVYGANDTARFDAPG